MKELSDQKPKVCFTTETFFSVKNFVKNRNSQGSHLSRTRWKQYHKCPRGGTIGLLFKNIICGKKNNTVINFATGLAAFPGV